MSINGISTSNNALYESLLQQIKERTKTPEDSAYANAAQSKTDSSVQAIQAPQPTQQDVKAMLSKLMGSQPTLLDFMSEDSSSTNDLSSLSIDLGGSSLGSSTDDITSFDPIAAQIKALTSMDSSSSANSDGASSDPLSAIWSTLGSNLSPSELSNLLEKAYSQSSQEAQSEVAAGQVVDKKK
jgi:hypothetical protein